MRASVLVRVPEDARVDGPGRARGRPPTTVVGPGRVTPHTHLLVLLVARAVTSTPVRRGTTKTAGVVTRGTTEVVTIEITEVVGTTPAVGTETTMETTITEVATRITGAVGVVLPRIRDHQTMDPSDLVLCFHLTHRRARPYRLIPRRLPPQDRGTGVRVYREDVFDR